MAPRRPRSNIRPWGNSPFAAERFRLVSLYRLVIVAVVFGATWLAAFSVVVAAVRRSPRCPNRFVVGSSIAYLALTALAFPYALYVEPFWPSVEKVELDSPKLRGRGVRIVHLSDLHSDPEARLEDEIPGLVDVLAPDLVVLTGDHVNSKQGIPTFRRCAKALADKYPTYAVKGNWEAWWFKDVDVFAGTGVVELDGSAEDITIGENRIWLAGVAVENERMMGPSLRAVPDGELIVFLHHFPAMAGQLSALGVDVHLAGDTHGGQMRLPLLGELVRISRSGVWESAGLHKKNDMWLYVNRGIGMEGGGAPRVRFGCRPEIAVIDIRPRSD